MKLISIAFISLVFIAQNASAATENLITCVHDTSHEGKGGSGESFSVSIQKVRDDTTATCTIQWVFEGASWQKLLALKYVGRNAQSVRQIENRFYAIGSATQEAESPKVTLPGGACQSSTSLSLMINSSSGLARLTLTKHGWDKRLLFPELWGKTNGTWAFSAQQFPLYFTQCTPDDPKSDRFPIQ